jgi:acetyl esterase
MKTVSSTFKSLFKLSLLVLTLIVSQKTFAQTVDYNDDPHLTPEVKKFLAPLNSGGRPLESFPPVEARKVLVNAQNAFPVDYSGIEESTKIITQDGYKIKINIVRPAGSKGVKPAFIFIHGGGWVLGDYPTHRRMVHDLVVLTGYTGIFINYTPTPDAHYPTQINEIYASAKWIASHGAELSINPNKLGIVGNSVGGNMATVTTLMAKEKGGPKFKVQILMWPVTDANFDRDSYTQYAQQRFLTTPLMKWMWDLYTQDPEQRKERFASPLEATTEQLKGLPPALIQVAENDILRDEGEAYGRKLKEAGVTCTTVRYNGMIHDWGLLNGLANTPESKSAFVQAAAELKKYLH